MLVISHTYQQNSSKQSCSSSTHLDGESWLCAQYERISSVIQVFSWYWSLYNNTRSVWEQFVNWAVPLIDLFHCVERQVGKTVYIYIKPMKNKTRFYNWSQQNNMQTQEIAKSRNMFEADFQSDLTIFLQVFCGLASTLFVAAPHHEITSALLFILLWF